MTPQVERHSISSLSLRTGLNRAVLLGALASGRLPVVERAKVGSRTVYDIKTTAVEDFVLGFRQRLQDRVDKLASSPFEREQRMLQALRVVRDDLEKEQGLESPDTLVERYGISRELATWLLNKHGQRVEGGWNVTAEGRAAIERHIEETRGSRKGDSRG